MQTKLTLRLENELIQHAKSFANRQDKSLSQVVADYFQALVQPSDKPEIPPITQSLTGIMSGHQVSQEDYKKYLEDKHF